MTWINQLWTWLSHLLCSKKIQGCCCYLDCNLLLSNMSDQKRAKSFQNFIFLYKICKLWILPFKCSGPKKSINSAIFESHHNTALHIINNRSLILLTTQISKRKQILLWQYFYMKMMMMTIQDGPKDYCAYHEKEVYEFNLNKCAKNLNNPLTFICKGSLWHTIYTCIYCKWLHLNFLEKSVQ